ncbi:MAG TPA: VCBS repeat-containing protein [Bacteroidetes bacterium]|nr:VCBS repeat-containing protein [Bacteroidota bacterium]
MLNHYLKSRFALRHKPNYAEGVLPAGGKRTIAMDLEMIVPVAFDWDRDGDGLLDLLVNSRKVNFLRNTGTNKHAVFRDMGEADDLTPAGHSTSPAIVDWDKNVIPAKAGIQ